MPQNVTHEECKPKTVILGMHIFQQGQMNLFSNGINIQLWFMTSVTYFFTQTLFSQGFVCRNIL